MSQQDDGGPAFPDDRDQVGMSLRDYFAGQALNQALAMEVRKRQSMISPPPFDADGVAKACYDVADAMLVERSK